MPYRPANSPRHQRPPAGSTASRRRPTGHSAAGDTAPGASLDASNTEEQQKTAVLYTPAEAAALLRVRPSWLTRKAAARAIACTYLGKHLRFSPADLTAIIAAGAVTPSPPRSATLRRQ